MSVSSARWARVRGGRGATWGCGGTQRDLRAAADAGALRAIAIIPAFDEEDTLATVVHLARPHVDAVLVVDDGSTDRTAALAEAAGAEVLRLPRNRGKGAALQAGFAAAVKQGYEAVVTLDADLQHDADQIPALLGPLRRGDADLVVGSRRLSAEQRRGIPRHRRVGQAVFAGAARVSGTRIADTESGFRAYRASLLEGLVLREEGFGADWEALLQAAGTGARIVEVPVAVRYDDRSAARRSALAQGASVGAAVLRLVHRDHPLLFFGLPGSLLSAAGFILGAQTATHYYSTGEFWPGKGMLAMLLTIVGCVAIFAALTLHSIALMLRRR